MARSIPLLLRLRRPPLRHRRPHPRPMSCCTALQLHRKLPTASLMLPRWLSAETCEMERRTVRCAVLATRHAGMESASGLHLFLIQSCAGAVLRRHVLNLAYVFGQAVQMAHSETVRHSSESRAQSARITYPGAVADQRWASARRSGFKALFRARRSPTMARGAG